MFRRDNEKQPKEDQPKINRVAHGLTSRMHRVNTVHYCSIHYRTFWNDNPSPLLSPGFNAGVGTRPLLDNSSTGFLNKWTTRCVTSHGSMTLPKRFPFKIASHELHTHNIYIIEINSCHISTPVRIWSKRCEPCLKFAVSSTLCMLQRRGREIREVPWQSKPYFVSFAKCYLHLRDKLPWKHPARFLVPLHSDIHCNVSLQISSLINANLSRLPSVIALYRILHSTVVHIFVPFHPSSLINILERETEREKEREVRVCTHDETVYSSVYRTRYYDAYVLTHIPDLDRYASTC